MFRSLVVLVAILCTIECTSAIAQGHGKACRNGGHHRSHYPTSSFGFSIGIGSYPGYGYSSFGYLDPYRFDGYGYDPYRYGSFRAPDLLDDPYFRERYRYDSRFPGRHPNRYRAPLVVRPVYPLPAYDAYGIATPHTDHGATQAVPAYPADIAGQLRSACQQLSRSLSTLQNGHAWIGYLAPHQISRMIATGNSAGLIELLTRYDGVVGNPQYGLIEAAGGFDATRSLLSQYVGQPTELIGPVVDEPTVESLPLPEPIAVPESSPLGELDI